MNNFRINYIIGTYFGRRRMETVGDLNGLYLSELHLKQLSKLKHNIQKIYIAVPDQEFNNDIYEKVKKYPDLNVEVIKTGDNKGFAYGSWNICLHKTCDEADFSIITEDDYIPVIDNFDDIFLEYFTDEKVAYVCQLLSQIPDKYESSGAELCQGMIRNSIFKKSGGFKITGYGYHEAALTQGLFLENILKSGYRVKDTIDKYKTFYDRCKRISLYGNPNHPEIFKPMECILWDCNKYIVKHNNNYITEEERLI